MTNPEPFTYMPNTHQTPDERKAKYNLLMSYGLSSGWAQAMRDWHQVTIDNSLQMKFDTLQSKSNGV